MLAVKIEMCRTRLGLFETADFVPTLQIDRGNEEREKYVTRENFSNIRKVEMFHLSS